MLKYLRSAISRKLPSDHFNKGIEYGGLIHNFKYIFPSIRKTWRAGIAAGVFLVVSSLLAWPLPMIMRYLIDNVLLKKNMALLLPVAALIAALGLSVFLADLLQNFLSTRFTEETILDLRQRLLEKVFSLPKIFFDKNHSGYIISRVSSDVEGVKYFISGTVIRLFIEAMRFLGGMIFLFYLEWRVALGVLVTLPLSFVLTRFFSRKNYAVSHISSEVNANLNATYVETISSAQLIKSFTNEDNAVSKILKQVKNRIQLIYENTTLNALSNAVNKLMPSLAKLAVLIIGSYWVITAYWEVGTLIAYLAYLAYVYNPINQLSSSVNQLQSARATLDRIASLLEIAPEENTDTGISIKSLKGEVEFRNVSFGYDKGKRILDDISFKVNPGEHWAVIGRSGIGKTTLISLIMYFYKPQGGRIYFDGTDVSEVNVKSLRKRIGYVSQNIQLLSGTILDNLKYGNSEATLDEAVRSAKAAQIHDFIETLPGKYETVLSEKGINLSEGQKQRISLARTLIGKADILILDEPTSALDNATENSICSMLRDYFSDRTVFLIAHRPDTIKMADNIILLRENKTPLIGRLKDLENEPEIKEVFMI